MIKEYLEYLKDNPEHYWFKSKLYGWGWVPATWQGWALLGIFILFAAWDAISLDSNKSTPTIEAWIWFFIKIGAAAIVFILICYATGEKPCWQWGLPKRKK